MIEQSAQPAGDGATAITDDNGRGGGSGEGRGKGYGVDRLEGYRLALELARVAPGLVPRGHGALRDQIDRAAVSAVLNCAEGWGRWRPREKMHFYAIARGSVVEAVAGIDIVEARGLASREACGVARALGERVARILTGLIRSVERRG